MQLALCLHFFVHHACYRAAIIHVDSDRLSTLRQGRTALAEFSYAANPALCLTFDSSFAEKLNFRAFALWYA